MCLVRHLILVSGLLIAAPGFVCSQTPDNTTPVERTKRPEIAGPGAPGPAQHSTISEQADAAYERATRLRHTERERELKRALFLFQQSARLYEAAGDHDRAAESHIQAGEIYFDLSRYEQALASYHRALKIASGKTDRLCRALSHLARTYASIGQSSIALSNAQQARDMSQGLSDATAAEALEAYGEALYWSGDSVQAIGPLREALQIYARIGQTHELALTKLFLSEALFRAGNREEGVQLAGDALRLWNSIGSSYGIAQARSMLGTFAIMAGEFDSGRCNAENALPVFRTIGDRDAMAVALNILGYTNMELGDPQESLEYYQQARTAFAAVQDWLGEAQAITGMGSAFRALKEPGRLLPLYRAKLRLARSAQNQLLVASALGDIADVYELQGEHIQAERLYRQALATYHSAQNPYREGDTLIALAHLHQHQKKFDQAISELEEALTLKKQASQIEHVARIQYELAAIYIQTGRLDDALSTIQQTIDIIETQRLTISQFDSRASYFASVHRYYSLYIQALMLLHRRNPDRGFMQSALEASEKSKVRALLDLLNSPAHGPPCEEMLRRQLLSGELTQTAKSGAQQPAAAAVSLRLSQIQAEIVDDDTALVEYALGEERSYAWVVQRNRVSVYELPPAARIRKLAALFRNSLTARQPLTGENMASYRKRVQQADVAYRSYERQLSAMLLAPLELGEVKRLLIVPDGPLQYIPFAGMALPRGRQPLPVLVSRYEIVMLPSASALATLRTVTANRPQAKPLAAIFADPVFEANDSRMRSAHSHFTAAAKPPSDLRTAMRDVNRSAVIRRLPGSGDEAKAIREALGKNEVLVVTGFEATREKVLSGMLSQYRIVHFATHGVIDAKHPEMSGLILSLLDDRGRRIDGYLRLGDIYKLRLSADLVVLSACDSAMGKDLESEGIIGLPRGFLHAGAKTVIASLWKVEDSATAELMKDFYARIHNGASPAEALRGAQLEMSRSPDWSAPFYWAGFVLQGDYN